MASILQHPPHLPLCLLAGFPRLRNTPQIPPQAMELGAALRGRGLRTDKDEMLPHNY